MLERTLQACFYPRFGHDKPDKIGDIVAPPRAPLQSGDFIQKIADRLVKFMPKSRLFDRIDGNNWFKLMDAKHRVYNYKDNEFHMAKASDRLYRKLPKAFEYLEFVDLE